MQQIGILNGVILNLVFQIINNVSRTKSWRFSPLGICNRLNYYSFTRWNDCQLYEQTLKLFIFKVQLNFKNYSLEESQVDLNDVVTKDEFFEEMNVIKESKQRSIILCNTSTRLLD